jgi:CheY-like chemotaxis protein
MADTKGKKVLVVEDDKFLIKIYETKLKEEGLTVIIAVNGEEGITKAKAEQPDLILLDLIMPVKSGFEALAEIKADDTIKHIPVIILSNLGQDADIKKGTELGAADFIIKSNMALHEVVKIIKKYL